MEDNQIGLSSNILEFLNNPGAEIKNLSGKTLARKDIFVFPELLSKSLAFGRGSILSSEQLINAETLPDITLITGADNSGKTTLLKTLMKSYFDSGSYPLLLDIKQAGAISENQLWELIRSGFERQYAKNGIQKIIGSENQKKICLIDNAPGRLFKKTVISKLLDEFGHVVLFSDSPLAADVLPGLLNEKTTTGIFELLELGPELRETLCRKWHTTVNPGDSSEVRNKMEADIQSSVKVLEEALSHGLAPSYPIIVLSILNRASSDEQYSPLDSTYASYIEHIIIKPLREGPHSAEIENLKSALSRIGFEMFDSGRSDLTEPELGVILGEEVVQITAALISAGLLVRHGRGIEFKYEFSYSYFAASFCARNLDKDEIRQKVRGLCQSFGDEQSASIMLFLTYLSDDPFIDEEITKALEASHKTRAPETITDRLNGIDELIDSIIGTGKKDRKLKELRAKYSSTKDTTPGPIITTSYAREYKTPAQTERLIEHIDQIIYDLRLLETSGEALKKKLLQEQQNPETLELKSIVINFWLRSLAAALDNLNPPLDKAIEERIHYSSTESRSGNEPEKLIENKMVIDILTLYVSKLSEVFGGKNPSEILSEKEHLIPEGSKELIDILLKLTEKQIDISGAKK